MMIINFILNISKNKILYKDEQKANTTTNLHSSIHKIHNTQQTHCGLTIKQLSNKSIISFWDSSYLNIFKSSERKHFNVTINQGWEIFWPLAHVFTQKQHGSFYSLPCIFVISFQLQYQTVSEGRCVFSVAGFSPHLLQL